MIDVVYALGTGSIHNNNELRYSLRSIAKHLKNYRSIYIIGECPAWVNNVFHVPYKDNDYKEVNILNKIVRACNIEQLSDNFLFMNDDHFFIQDVDAEKYPYYHSGDLQNAIMNRETGQAYRHTLHNTKNVLSKIDKSTTHFDVHTPIIYNKKKFLELAANVNFKQTHSMVIKSMYCNYHGIKGEQIEDLKINRKLDFNSFINKLHDRNAFSIGDAGYNPDVFNYLYPVESKYEKTYKANGKIGIGITTHNRHESCNETYDKIKALTPHAKIIIVDDASAVPYPKATYRFNKNVGIAKAKNKCIELLHDCDYVFLFDDDTYPVVENWFTPYIKAHLETGNNHFCMTWNRNATGRANGHKLISSQNGINEYSSPCGCMMFYTKKVFETVGGFDEGFEKWGDEHVEYSQRIFNAGLNKKMILDVAHSLKLFYAKDYYATIQSTTLKDERLSVWPKNNRRLKAFVNSKEYKPFMQNNNAIFTSYFNHNKDVQRGKVWDADLKALMPLINSVRRNGERIFIFHNCFKDSDIELLNDQQTKFIKVKPEFDVLPNMARWIEYDKYLNEHSDEFENVFFTDSTDVIMLKSPFKVMDLDKIYTGDEYNQRIDNKWMAECEAPNFKIYDYAEVIEKNADKTLLNCGIVGGSMKIMRHFIHHLANLHRDYSRNTAYSTDMAAFNYLCHKHYYSIVSHGKHVNTRFKTFEVNNVSWFQHK